MTILRVVLGSVLAPTIVSILSPLSIAPPDPIVVPEIPVSTATVLQMATPQRASSSSESYLPRRLYPGTYQNYCGPTPEVQVKGGCVAHGWHGDDPVDRVDDARRLHDISYCNCEAGLLSRQRHSSSPSSQEEEEEIPLLSSMAALRFLTKPVLEQTVHADPPYFDCINKADRQLIVTGIQVRGEMQRSGCSMDQSLSWFCDVGESQGTLDVFEKVNLKIFLRDLDADYGSGTITREQKKQRQGRVVDVSLSDLEHRRQLDLKRELKNGKTVADAASSQIVRDDEDRILRKLLFYDTVEDPQLVDR
jgi:hypothetical protein